MTNVTEKAVTKRKLAKNHSIYKIMENNVYMPNSGVYTNLRKALNKLSATEIESLRLIIEIKQREVTDR